MNEYPLLLDLMVCPTRAARRDEKYRHVMQRETDATSEEPTWQDGSLSYDGDTGIVRSASALVLNQRNVNYSTEILFIQYMWAHTLFYSISSKPELARIHKPQAASSLNINHDVEPYCTLLLGSSWRDHRTGSYYGEELGDTLNIVPYCDWGLSCSRYEVRLQVRPGTFIKRLRLSAHASSPGALGRNFQYQGAERTFYKPSAFGALCVFSRKVLIRRRSLITRILMIGLPRSVYPTRPRKRKSMLIVNEILDLGEKLRNGGVMRRSVTPI